MDYWILTLWVLIHHVCVYFVVEINTFGHLEHFWTVVCDLSTRLRFLAPGFLRLILSFPCCIPEISRFSKEPWFLSVENGLQKPRAGCQVCLLPVGVIASRLFQQTELENINVRIYTHRYICFFVYLYVQYKPWIHTNIFNSSATPQNLF